MVTVTGSNLDSVAEPRINLTVVVKRTTGDIVSTSPATSTFEVLLVCYLCLLCSGAVSCKSIQPVKNE